MRKILILCIPILLLTACGQPRNGGGLAQNFEGMRGAPLMLRAPASPDGGDNQSFSYTHALGLEMERENVAPRFERTRKLCLLDKSLSCRLVSSSIDTLDNSGDAYYRAEIVVALPHDKISEFEATLIAPVGSERRGDAQIVSRLTTAQNLTADAGIAKRKAAQLADYRDRLEAMAKHPSLSVNDLIKVEEELSKTQSDLDEADSQKNDIDDRIAREQVSIMLGEKPSARDAFRPITNVINNGIQTLADSTASALQFAIELIPWLPLIAGAMLLLRWLWRIARRRGSVAKS